MDTNLREQILSDTNIYNAIYAVESYISERDLLESADLALFLRLRDKFDFNGAINRVIKICKLKLSEILDTKENLFEVKVFFKLKKLNDEDNSIEYRPLHTSCLVNQICMAAMLMPLMFDDTSGKRELSELSGMLPHNFYGNIPSCNVKNLFMNWTEKYRQYTQIVNNRSREYSKTREYDREISFDLKDFFPSINPRKILDFIWNAISCKYSSNDDKHTLKTVITKLLYFKIPKENLDGWESVYYKDKGSVNPVNGFYPSRGIAQGLPQSYFFGNLCMIEIADKMNRLKEFGKTDSYFYVDDSVVFAKNISVEQFSALIEKLNDEVSDKDRTVWAVEPTLGEEYARQTNLIKYCIEFHRDGKSTICEIENSFSGMDGLFLVQRPISMGGWIRGNIDEVDDNVALKKLTALQEVVDTQINRVIEKIETNPGLKINYESRLKWLRRYRRYFLFRQRKLQIMLNGEFDEKLLQHFRETFKIKEVVSDKIDVKLIQELFDIFEEDIFKSEFELLLHDMPQEWKKEYCEDIKNYDIAISQYNHHEYRNTKYLYYYQISTTLLNLNAVTVTGYDALYKIVRKVNPFRSSAKFIESFIATGCNDDIWKIFTFLKYIVEEKGGKEKSSIYDCEREFPSWCRFIFNNSDNFKRKILNCCFSYACNILPGDNLSIIRTDIKPVRYYELRILSMLRNSRLNIQYFFEFIRTFKFTELNEQMNIDLEILEALGIFRQKVQAPDKIDRLIQTHRLVKSLWHNGSKFLNAYTLHNQEHAINLIKNIVRLVNNVDFLNLKTNDFFLVFNACYLHDISMVIHPNIASFNDSNVNSDKLISKWLNEIISLNNQLDAAFKTENFNMRKVHLVRKNMGLALVSIFQDVFDFFETRVRNPHATESARLIRAWQNGMLSFLSELEADAIATISDSHGWDISDVYELKSAAKEELVSLKYMMILIRIADLLDLANDRIDYYILKQNRSQMNPVSRYHWISHLITERYELDADFIPIKGADLTEHPIKEHIHLDVFLNTKILAHLKVHKQPCKGICASLTKLQQYRYPKNSEERECIEFIVGQKDGYCKSKLCQINGNSRSCPFLCAWMSDKHWWLFSELGKLNHYLNSVNSDLIHTDISVRFFYNNSRDLDSEFRDDVQKFLTAKY